MLNGWSDREPIKYCCVSPLLTARARLICGPPGRRGDRRVHRAAFGHPWHLRGRGCSGLVAGGSVARAFARNRAGARRRCARRSASPTSSFRRSDFVENPDDWIALITFSLTALVVGELELVPNVGASHSGTASEIEQLYAQVRCSVQARRRAEAARRNEQLKSALLDALTHNGHRSRRSRGVVTAMLSSGNVDVTSLTTANRRELLLVIDEEADRLNRFIEALSGADRPDRRTGNVPGCRRRSSREGSRGAAETVARHHHVRVTIEPHMPQLAVDRSAIGEAIYTLIDNASNAAAQQHHHGSRLVERPAACPAGD